MTRTVLLRTVIVASLAAMALAAAACDKPDASRVTSPSIIALLGTSEGTPDYDPQQDPPADQAAPEGWSVDVGNARFNELENGAPAIQVVTQVSSRPGPELNLWLSGPEGPVWHWSGGSAREYHGVVCFQVRLEDEGEAMPLSTGPLRFSMAFSDPGGGDVVFAKTIDVAGFLPKLEGTVPGPESDAGRVLLGCPRSVI
ncbi:MAG: hypothetical protein M0R74_06905 [Dehalococcoidia bacterium]|nr:hypothetical protein [Dehalococcoidia bacterium]